MLKAYTVIVHIYTLTTKANQVRKLFKVILEYFVKLNFMINPNNSFKNRKKLLTTIISTTIVTSSLLGAYALYGQNAGTVETQAQTEINLPFTKVSQEGVDMSVQIKPEIYEVLNNKGNNANLKPEQILTSKYQPGSIVVQSSDSLEVLQTDLNNQSQQKVEVSQKSPLHLQN